jgi:hypothetical protein
MRLSAVSMGFACFGIFAVSCKSRDYNSDISAIENRVNNKRLTVGAVYDGSGGAGWCYFNHDNNFKTHTNEYSEGEVFSRWSRAVETWGKNSAGDTSPMRHAVNLTLRRYTRAHPNALTYENLDALQKIKLEQSTERINLVTLIQYTLQNLSQRAGSTTVQSELCSPDLQIDEKKVAEVEDTTFSFASRSQLKATCNGQSAGIVATKPEVSLKVPVDGADYEWLQGKLTGLTKFNSKLSCPAEYYEVEVSPGRPLGYRY